MTSYSPTAIWLIVGFAAAGTWALRLSFIALLRRDAVVPPAARRILALIPAAVLAALVAPALIHTGGELALVTPRSIAGIAAALVAWRTENVLATIGTGMAMLWLLQWVW